MYLLFFLHLLVYLKEWSSCASS